MLRMVVPEVQTSVCKPPLVSKVKKPKNVPVVLVGNKSDLEHVRQVGVEEGERMAAEMACAFYECSACADEGGAVAEAFHEVCREVSLPFFNIQTPRNTSSAVLFSSV